MTEQIILTADHITTYQYEWPVSWASHVGHLAPRNTGRQTVLESQILIDPTPTWISRTVDYFGNNVVRFSLEDHHESLTVTATMAVQVGITETPDPLSTSSWSEISRTIVSPVSEIQIDANSFLFGSPHAPATPELAAFARKSFYSDRPVLDALLDLNSRIHNEFEFDAEATNIATPVETVLRRRHGVCQDFAHLMIAALRSIGLPACYVSGYIRTGNESEDGLIGADASHAWVSVYCGDAGWIDIDPTNNCIPSRDHLTVAWGRDFQDVSPLKGVILGGGKHIPEVGVTVTARPA